MALCRGYAQGPLSARAPQSFTPRQTVLSISPPVDLTPSGVQDLCQYLQKPAVALPLHEMKAASSPPLTSVFTTSHNAPITTTPATPDTLSPSGLLQTEPAGK